MTTRTSSKILNFEHPFIIGTLTELQPAGSYRVDTEEELIEGLSFVAYKRISTVIHLHSKSKLKTLTRALTITPKDLDIAVRKDKAANGNILKNLQIDYKF